MELITGALPSVITKLDDLIGEYNLPKGIEGVVRLLRSELESMKGALEKLSSTPPDQLDVQDKIWSRDLRELSYDIEDSIDAFMVRAKGDESAKLHGIENFMDRIVSLLTEATMIRLKIPTEIKDIKSRVSGVDKPTTTTMVDPRLFAQYTDTKELVGIDESRDELIKVLMDGNGVPLQQGKIVSIVGFGGLGKTTVAKAVYEKIRAQFDCCAFVSVSQTPDLKKLFKELLFDLGSDINEEIFDESRLISLLREFLELKRYLIVIDDICHISVWNVIKLALPDNDAGYIVITTTRNIDVAEKAGGAYKLRPLSMDNSRKLLYRRVFGNENNDNSEDIEKCPDEELEEVSNGILKKCAGVPLVIIMMASLLACKERNKMDWYEVYHSIGTGLDYNLDVENMGKILSFCYYNMPSHLRTCLLYLSMFPEDYKIDKDRLIWMWIAEGFIQCEKQGNSLFELGECYFNELINRSMIQPIYSSSDMVYGCRVHDMVLYLIWSLSKEANFVTISNGMDLMSPSSKIRRLSIQNDSMTLTHRSLQQVRSVVVLPLASIRLIPVLESSQILRVMDLQYCDLSHGNSINKCLGNLFHLRYLGLVDTRIVELPKEIGNLQFLQILNICRNNISCLPSSVAQLKHLMCLDMDRSTRVPNGIGNLTRLEKLSGLSVDESNMDIIEELGQLTELRVLHIFLDKWNDKLVECLRKLHKIQDLCIWGQGDLSIWDQGGQRNMVGGLDAWAAPQCLQSLGLRSLGTQRCIWFSKLPAWMNPLLLPYLSSLSIAVRELHQVDLENLGELPNLCYLDLTVDHECLGSSEKFVIRSYLFPCLVQCRFFGFLVPLMFQKGAMPRLASIEMEFQVQNIRGSIDGIGLGNLPVIQDVTILLNCKGVSKGNLEEVKAALRHAIELHPSQPTLLIFTGERDIVVGGERGSMSSLPSTLSQTSHVKEVHEKHKGNKIDGFVAKPDTTTVFPCLFSEYMKGPELVGIEEAVNELINILTEGNEMSTSQGKILSIVGLGGLGKTTLARAIYGKLRAQFDCWAFVSVSQSPDMMKLFKCMLYQLGKKNSANIHEEILDERPLIYELTEFLQNRRYFIVIDGVEDISFWKMIKCALPATNDGCIIITTTRVLDVAKQVGVAYRMRHLCLENSRILLHRRIFGAGERGRYFDDELVEISEKILQRCGGIPLVIIMISGLLASKGGNKIEWNKVYRSMKYSDPDEQIMKNIVSLCYEDLPSHLKPCLLYLSVFPAGYDIDKDRLIQLWISEGLIQCGKQDESPFRLGESYFQELINRCMIQPVYKRWYYDMTECCHVHDMVLDLISEVTGKEKLVSVWNRMNQSFHSQEVQWLSLQNSMSDHATHRATINMEGVTSVVVFPSAVKVLPDLASFRDLLVLDLQGCCLSQGRSTLNHLGHLVHLTYLGLRDTGISHLSEEVGSLRSLQTLDVRRNEISSLPATVVELKHLVCLGIDSWTRAPNGIGSFTSLEELSTLCIQDSTDIIEELGNLTELRMLGIDCCTEWNVSGVEKSLVECLLKLQKIKTLSISMVGECNLDSWVVAPRHLRRLELTGCWPSTVPALLNNPSLLLDLSFLSIEVMKLWQEDLESLGRLPALGYLDIEVGNQKLGNVQTLIIGARSFPCLVHCTLRGYIGPIVFQEGAMPEVARLHLAFPVREIREAAGTNGAGFDDLGFGNLPRLQDVSFLLRRERASKGEVEEAEAALRQAIESHPNHPTLEIL